MLAISSLSAGQRKRTLPVRLCATSRETVTVAVLFMHPTLVTTPIKAMGGIFAFSVSLARASRERSGRESDRTGRRYSARPEHGRGRCHVDDIVIGARSTLILIFRNAIRILSLGS